MRRRIRLGGMIAALLLAAVATLLSPVATPAAAETRVALVIGNSDSTHLPDLANAAKDAEDMAAALRRLGFETILRVNASEREVHRALGQFEVRLGDGAVGLAFFAGHGIQAGGTNYLIPADANIEVEDDLRAEALTARAILQAMQRAGNPMNILILDACRDNPLPRRSRSARSGLTAPALPKDVRGTATLYAAGAGEPAEDGPPGGNGIFTGELLQVLDEPGLTLEQVDAFCNQSIGFAGQRGSHASVRSRHLGCRRLRETIADGGCKL